MGNSNSLIDFEHKIVANNYNFVRKTKDARLGELAQMKNEKTGQIVLMKEKFIQDPATYRQVIEGHVEQLSLRHQNLVKIYGIAGSGTNNPSNGKCRVFIYFEYLPTTLQQIIYARKAPLATRTNENKET